MRTPLTNEEKNRIRELAPATSVKQIARMLGRSESTIETFMLRNRIPRFRPQRQPQHDPARADRMAKFNELPPGKVITTIYRGPEK